MAAKQLPSQDVLNQLLRYEAETGKLFWKKREAKWFNDKSVRTATHIAKNWNSRHADKEAFTASGTGYRRGSIFDVDFLAHRIIWRMVTGEEPDQIDHINGDRNDNRIGNLRSVSELENKRNMMIPSHNSSGRIGVSYCSGRASWEAYISLGDKKINLGRFKTFEEAVAARKAAEQKHGFHTNHGRAA